MKTTLKSEFCEELKGFGFKDEVFARHTNANRDMFNMACGEASDIDERLRINEYLCVDFRIDTELDSASCIITLYQYLFDFGGVGNLVIVDGLRDIQSFEVNVKVVESSGDWQEDIRIMCEFLAEIVLEVVDKFAENL